jgi:hypothetical protein
LWRTSVRGITFEYRKATAHYSTFVHKKLASVSMFKAAFNSSSEAKKIMGALGFFTCLNFLTFSVAHWGQGTFMKISPRLGWPYVISRVV